MKFKVFGCKANKYYTEEWLKSDYFKDKKGIFIASCVVTDKAKRKWLKFVKDTYNELKSKKSEEKIFISGCGAFKDGVVQKDFFEIYPELLKYKDKIVLLGEKPKELQRKIIGRKEQGNFSLNKTLEGKKIPQIYTKKFLLIQGGCDSFCSFCLTVQKRGKHYFRAKEDIVEEILEFENFGGKEIVLTGINLAAWGLETTNIGKILTFGDEVIFSEFSVLLDYILKNTKISRIRISSMGPEFIDDKCLKIFKNTRIYPHFHYSVQSGSSKILKSMRRHYDGKYIKYLLEKTKNIKRDDGVEISIGADIIVGFPGETEEDFKKTYNLFTDGLITKLHAFPFSPHTFGESVPAGKFLNQIDEKTKKDRMQRLELKSEEVRQKFKKGNIGKNFKVLVEAVKKDEKTGKIKWKGWTENYIEASDKNFEVLRGKIERNNLVEGILK